MGGSNYVCGEDGLWLFDELDDDAKEFALGEGCEPGKAYIGSMENCCEARTCPFCSSPAWIHSGYGCKHIIFVFDRNAGYVYIHKEFALIFWDEFAVKKESALDDYDSETLKAINDGDILPDIYGLEEFLPLLKSDSISDPFGAVGLEYGFLPDEVMEQYDFNENVDFDYNV